MSELSKTIKKLKEIDKELLEIEGLEGRVDNINVYISGQKVDNEIKLEPGDNIGYSVSGEAYIENNEEGGSSVTYSYGNPFNPFFKYSPSSSRKLRSELLTSKHS